MFELSNVMEFSKVILLISEGKGKHSRMLLVCDRLLGQDITVQNKFSIDVPVYWNPPYGNRERSGSSSWLGCEICW